MKKLFTVLLLCLLTFCQDPIEAQGIAIPRDVAREDKAVILARTAWLEAGMYVHEHEVAAIHEVITQRMRGSYQQTAWQYSSGLRNPRRIATHFMGREPLSENYPASFREQWSRVLAAADASIAGTLTHECIAPSPLQHFGGPHVDRERLDRFLLAGYAQANCLGFANMFLYRRSTND